MKVKIMSGKRTGEVTEDYATYATHLGQAGFVGFIAGIVCTLIGLYTDWYWVAVTRYWYVVAIIVIIIIGYVYLKINGKARKNR